MGRRVRGSKDLEAGLGAILSRQAYFGSFMLEECYRFVAFDQVIASLRVLRILVMEVKTMLSVEVPMKGNVVVASENPLSLLIQFE